MSQPPNSKLGSPPSSSPSISDRFFALTFRTGQRLFLQRDVAVAERRGAKLGDLAFKLDGKHRDRTLENLKLAFPEWSDEKRFSTARECFRHWGRVTGDFLRAPLRTPEEVVETMEVQGMDIWESLPTHTKGTIACTAHMGNFERFGEWAKVTGHPILVVAREANQGGVQAEMEKIRAKQGVEFVGRGDAARPVLQRLRAGGKVGLLPDQNSDEAFVPFFGHPCGTVLGPAVIHKRTGATMLPAFCVRLGVGKYRVTIHEPIDVDNVGRAPEELMAEYNSVLESVVREFPEQYLWMHDRWKSARRKGLLTG